nr:hypothetical protein [uncultured Sphingomonas sp.]
MFGKRRIIFRLNFGSTEREYQAALNALNMFFGAVLGFLVTSFERLDLMPYVALLLLCSGVVMGIMFVANSPHRWNYVVLTAALIALLPKLVPGEGARPPKLQATFAVWLALTVLFEFAPRREPPAAAP